jgi:hypothetical protein
MKLSLFIFIVIFGMEGCVTTSDRRRPLSANDFTQLFFSDCVKIRVIYEGHGASGYYFENYAGGNYTRSHISLDLMSEWLTSCGANLKNVSKILE